MIHVCINFEEIKQMHAHFIIFDNANMFPVDVTLVIITL